MIPTMDVNKLRSKGFRLTPQRLTIIEVLKDAGEHLSPQDTYFLAQQRLPGLTEATVYRTLEFLTQQGIALVTQTTSGHLTYEIASREHHHLVCQQCGHTMEIEHSLLQSLYDQFKEKTGFYIDSSHMTFWGFCSDCIDSPKTSS